VKTLLLLALDTSTPTARVAVVGGYDALLAEAEATVDRHSAHVLRLCDLVLRAAGLRAADLTGIACGAGPGSFTGLRVGLAVAKGLALATGLPLIMVPSLEALAKDISDSGAGLPEVPCIDAGKGEVYAALAGDDFKEPLRLTPEALAARLTDHGPCVIAGNGADRYAAVLDAVLPANVSRATVAGPSARSIAWLGMQAHTCGHHEDLDSAVPLYGRLPDITTPKNPK
jgi:tRNA threonylcarbamoyladenosine biosynthesis protein TsaB